MGRFVCHEVPDGEETELENCSSNWDQCETNNSTVGFPLHMSISQSAGSSTRRTGQSQWPSEMRRFEFVGDHLQQDNPNLNSFSNSVQPHSNTGRNQEIERLYHERPNHHLYDCDFNNNFEQHESNIKNTRRNYMKHICFLAILLIFQRYIPPPPPPNQSWTEFVARSTETCVSTAQMVANLVMYVSCGCVQNMYRDYSHYFAMESNENSASSCSIALPLLRSNHDDNQTSIVSTEEHDNHLHYLMEKLTSNIAAQDIVLKNIVQNLKDWNDNEYTAKDESERRALSVMLTGPRGVGKYETALSLANMLLEQCQDYVNMNSDSLSHRILTLNGMDYVLDEDNANDVRTSTNVQQGLVRRILDHIYSHRGTGTVIIIKHLENISSRKKQELMHLIHQTKIMYTPKRSITQDTQTTSMSPNNWNVNNLILGKHDEDSKSIDLSLGGSAIIATSDLGADKIFEVLLKKSKGVHDELTYKAIEKAVGLEVANYYDENVSGEVPFV